jgi:hypothetical protein
MKPLKYYSCHKGCVITVVKNTLNGKKPLKLQSKHLKRLRRYLCVDSRALHILSECAEKFA